MKNLGKVKWHNVILMAVTAIALITFIGHLAFNAVIAESFKLNPPTAEEIKEDPSLARYAK